MSSSPLSSRPLCRQSPSCRPPTQLESHIDPNCSGPKLQVAGISASGVRFDWNRDERRLWAIDLCTPAYLINWGVIIRTGQR